MHKQAQRLSEEFRRMVTLHRRVLDRAAATTGVYRGQHHILMEISRNQICSQKELADIMDMSPAAVAVGLKKLEKGGYVRRFTDPKDNRFRQIQLTESGEQVARQSVELFSSIDGSMFDGCTQQEVQVLLDCFEKICRNLLEMEKQVAGGSGSQQDSAD